MWATKGIYKIMDLYKENELVPFEELKNKYGIPRTNLFKYLQLRSFIYSQTHSNTQPPLSILENLAVNKCIGKGQISLLYKILVKNHKDSTEHKRTQWIQDLQKDISEEDWSDICSRAQLLTINTHLKLIQNNWIMRTYVQLDRIRWIQIFLISVSNAIQKKAPYFTACGIALRYESSGMKSWNVFLKWRWTQSLTALNFAFLICTQRTVH